MRNVSNWKIWTQLLRKYWQSLAVFSRWEINLIYSAKFSPLMCICSSLLCHFSLFSQLCSGSDLWTSFYNFYLWIPLFAFLFIAFSAFFNEPRRERHPHTVVFVFVLLLRPFNWSDLWFRFHLPPHSPKMKTFSVSEIFIFFVLPRNQHGKVFVLKQNQHEVPDISSFRFFGVSEKNLVPIN